MPNGVKEDFASHFMTSAVILAGGLPKKAEFRQIPFIRSRKKISNCGKDATLMVKNWP
jgi:hypothetical protein